jgi:probable F420-dependent oxidoreductase
VTGVGLCLPQLGPHVTAEVVIEFARRAEALGYTSLWVQDHFQWPVTPRRGYAGRDGVPIPVQYQSVWAPTELLAFVAAHTSTVALGTSVLVAGNHWPVPLAQRLATLDAMSGGRLRVGLGVGWNAEEHEASGTDITTRGARMDDFVPALLACWGPDPVAYRGTFFDVAPSMVSPKPVQRPHPTLLSGMWSPAGLNRTVQWFDAWNPAGLPVATVADMVHDLNARRRPDQAPLEVYYRTFVQRPVGPPPAEDPLPVLVEEARQARDHDFAEIILEHNFWGELTSPQAWCEVPDRFASVVDAAAG